jgi:hypothetical protein
VVVIFMHDHLNTKQEYCLFGCDLQYVGSTAVFLAKLLYSYTKNALLSDGA